MPPHNDPLMRPLDIRYEPIGVYEDGTGIYTDGNRFYENNIVTRATFDADGLTWQKQYIDENCVTRPELEYKMNELKSNIYKIITEHVELDITEEEFMDLLKE